MVEADSAVCTESGAHAPHRHPIGTVMIAENSNQALALVAQRCGYDDLADGVRPVPLSKPRGHVAGADESGALWLSSESKMIKASERSGDDFAAPPIAMLGSPTAVAPGRHLCLLRHHGCPRRRHGRKLMDAGHERRGWGPSLLQIHRPVGRLIVWRKRACLSSNIASRSFEGSLHYSFVAAAAALKSGDRP